MKTNCRQGDFIPALLLALYIFIFLLTELTVNERCGAVLGRESVTAVYSLGIICTSAGYLCFYITRRICKSEGVRKLLICLFTAGYLVCTPVFMFTEGHTAFTVCALASLLLFGYIGGFVHYAVSLFLFGKVNSGKIAGAAIAAATLLQFVVQNLLVTDIALIISIIVAVCGISYLVMKPVRDWLFENPLPYSKEPSVKAGKLVLPVCIVAVMSVCFGLGDGLVTSLHAKGAIDLASYSRLFYALGVFAAGVIADIRGRRFLPLCTLCMLVLTAASALFIGDGGAARDVYVSVMYLFSGFYVMYLTLTFLDAAPMTDKPELWAGMGRIVRGIFIGITATLSNVLFESIGGQGVAITSVCLALVVLILFVISGGLNIRAAKTPPPKDRMREFLSLYKLTPRESEVLLKLVEGDDTNKDIASELFISVRMAERYITAIYEKTGARSRVGLVKLYYES